MEPTKSVSSRGTRSTTAEGRGQTKRGRGADDDGWGGFGNYMQAKKSKLNDQFDQDRRGKKSNIFAGVYVYVNGYTRPSSDELRKMMQAHGGRYETYLSKTRVTHIIASNLPNSKFKMAKTMPIVKPDWITDSIAAGKRLSHVPYLLLGNQSKLQPGLKSFSSVSSLHRSSSSLTSAASDASTVSSTASEPGPSDATERIDVQPNRNFSPRVVVEKLSEEDICRASQALVKTRNQSHRVSPTIEDCGKTPEVNACMKDPGSVSKELKADSEVKSTVEENTIKVKTLPNSDDHVDGDDDDDIVYNSDDGDDIVYNSDEDSSTFFGVHTSRGVETPENLHQIPLKRSRVYSLKKMKMSKSGSFDATRSDDNSSCDGFSHCPQVDQASAENSLIVNRVGVSSKLAVDARLTNTSRNKRSMVDIPSAASLQNCPSLHNQASSSLNHATTVLLPARGTGKLEDTSQWENLQTPSIIGQGKISHVYSDGTYNVMAIANHQPSILQSTREISPQNNSVSENMAGLAVPAKVQDRETSLGGGITGKHTPEKKSSCLHQPSPVSLDRKSGAIARAGDKGFLTEFYSNSRLHHLSTWGAEFKAYVSEIQRSGVANFPGREKLRQAHVEAATRMGVPETLTSTHHSVSSRVVMHIDMDCFFVSVGLLSRPDLRGKPVAVTHSKGQGSKPSSSSNIAWEQAEWKKKREGKLKGEKLTNFEDIENDEMDEPNVGYDFMVPRGSTGVQTFHSMAEIASCSYEARKTGVKNGMFMGRALQLCPDLQTIPYNFAEYNRISKVLYDLVASYTHDIEAVSCDEMLIDCTDVLTDTGATAMEFARLLRAEMMEITGCPASTGIGPNVLLAKLATRRAKPNGQFEVTSPEARHFIKDQPVADLPGVGYSMTRKLSKLDVQTCGQLQQIPVSTLRREFGPKTGESLHRFSVGQDDRPVKGDKQRKSVSAEVNYGIRFSKEPDAFTFLKELSGEVKRRLDAIQVKGRSITLKLMIRRPDAPPETAKFLGHGICNTVNKSSNLPVATNDGDLIAREVISMYKSQKVAAQDVRGIGIQINKLEGTSSSSRPGTRFSSASGHQSILNFAVAKTDAVSLKPNNSEFGPQAESSKVADSLSFRLKEDEEEKTLESENTRTAKGTGVSVFTLKRCQTSSLFPSTSTSTSSSSSSSRNSTALKNGGGNGTPSLFSTSSSSSSSLSHNASARAVPSVPHVEHSLVSSTSKSSHQCDSNTTSNPCTSHQCDSNTTSNPCTSHQCDSNATSNPCTSHQCDSNATSNPCSESHLVPPSGQKAGSTDETSTKSAGSSMELSALHRPGPSRLSSHQTAIAGPSTSSRHIPQSSAFEYLSLSQVDEEILSELPEDIAREVLADLTYRKRQQQQSEAAGSRETGGAGSAVRNQDSSSRNSRQTEAPEGRGDSSAALPALSQLNMSCFEALPENLQEEIRSEYARQEKEAAAKKDPGAQENYFTRLISPQKDKRQGQVTARGVPQRGRRGRPPGKKKLNFASSSRVRTSDTAKQVYRAAFSSAVHVVVCDDSDENTNDGIGFRVSEDMCGVGSAYGNRDDPKPQGDALITHERHYQNTIHGEHGHHRPHQKVPTPRASLCGAETLGDVRALLKEWLSSGPEPQAEDLALVSDYLAQLVQQRNLEMAYQLLKLLQRNSMRCEDPRWSDCLQTLVTLVQAMVCADYGACLKL